MAARDSRNRPDEEDAPTDVSVSDIDDLLLDGRYRLQRVIAQGGMSVVHLAEHVAIGRQVAIKVLKPPRAVADRYDFKAWFRKEARTLASLQHPNLVTLHDFGRLSDDAYFLVMEFVDGPSLYDILRDEGPLVPERAVRLAVQACLALRYAHGRGVIHLDVKPSNLLVAQEGGEEVVKVIDFGIAAAAGPDVILGSPDCMAPEQIEQGAVSPATDVYGLGCVLYRALTGVYPFRRGKPEATMLAHVTQPIPRMRAQAPEVNVPPALEKVVRRCLAKAPEDRFDDMGGLLEALGAYLGIPADAWTSGAFPVSGPLSVMRRPQGPQPTAQGRGVVPARPDVAPPPAPALGAEASIALPGAEPDHPPTVAADDDVPTPLPVPPRTPEPVAEGPPDGGLGWVVATGLTVLILAVAAGAWWAASSDDLGLATPVAEAPSDEADAAADPSDDDLSAEDASPDEAVDDRVVFEPPTPDGPPDDAPAGAADASPPEAPADEARDEPVPQPPPPSRRRTRRPAEATPPPSEPDDEVEAPKGYKAMPEF